jgi:FG-GAP-like repeat
MASTIRGAIRRTPFYAVGSLILAASVAAGFVIFHATARASLDGQSPGKSVLPGGLRSFEIVPLETVSETSSNASIGDLNGDGHPDIVLVKGRYWQVTSKIFFGDGQGHFTPGPALPSKAAKSTSASLPDMTRSGHLEATISPIQS